MSDKITTLHLKNDPSINIYPNVKIENIPLDATITRDGENLAKTKTIYEFMTSNFLSLHGGTVEGEISTGLISEKSVLGDGLDVINYSSPENTITHYGAGYIDQQDDENISINYEYKFPKKSGTFALKEELEELKSLVYSLHSLTYNSYEFPYLTSSIIPDEVDGRKVVGGSYAIADWVGGNSVVTDDEIKSTIVSKIETYSTKGVKLGQINIPNAPITLNGVNDIHDLLTFEEQSDGTYNAILTRNTDIFDLGTLDWSYWNGRFNTSQPLSDIVGSINNDTKANAICSRYEIVTPNQSVDSSKDKTIAIYSDGYIYARDSAYTDETTFKTAMSGVYLLCERAIPTTEVIATGLTFEQVYFLTEKGGTIEAVYEEVPPTISVNFMTKGE